MSKRPSLTNIVPIEHVNEPLPSQPERSRNRHKSVPPRSSNGDKEEDKRSISAERAPATSPTPPVRIKLQEHPKVVPKIRRLPRKPRFVSKSDVPHSPPSVLDIGGTRMYASEVLTRSDLDAIQAVIRQNDQKTPSRDPPVSSDEAKRFRSHLRDCTKRKSTFRMTFQPRGNVAPSQSQDFANPYETTKSTDSGVFSIPGDNNESFVGAWRRRWQKSQAGAAPDGISSIKGICFTRDDRVAVTEDKPSKIQIFDIKRGESFRVVEDPFPTHKVTYGGICQLPDRNFFAATDRQNIVYIEPTADGLCRRKTFEKQIHLHGIAVNSKEHLFLTDLEKKRVYSYDVSGKRILKFKPDDFLRPEYIAVSEEYSMVFVSDSEQGCVYMFSMDGELLYKLGRQGDDQEKLVYPLGVCCQPNGKLIVADRGQHRILTFDFRARCYEHLLTRDDKLYSPTCIASDGSKYLAVAEENHDFKVDEYKLTMFYKRGR